MVQRYAAVLLLSLLAAGCAKQQVKPVPEEPVAAPCDCPKPSLKADSAIKAPQKPNTNAKEIELKPVQLPNPTVPVKPKVEAERAVPASSAIGSIGSMLTPAAWQDLDGLMQDNVKLAWPAWLQSCSTLIKRPAWQAACSAAQRMQQPNNAQIIAYFTTHFNVFKANNENGTDTGKITGYYQPVLKGSQYKTAQYPYPLYREPNDLITVELAAQFPELKFKRVRGRLQGNKLYPYLTRAEIDTPSSPLAGTEIFWINDIIDVFFLHIQGSGVVELESGERIQVGYANQNGHRYHSIGRLLIRRGELAKHEASMQGIKNWARNNLDKVQDLLNSNPSYVFFKKLPEGLPGPLGALGVPVSAERSIAVDRKFIPLGAPVFLSTTQPNSDIPLKRLMMAQDTGGAIKGGVRADFFWGAGDAAGAKAGSMNQQGKMWVLLPKGFRLQ